MKKCATKPEMSDQKRQIHNLLGFSALHFTNDMHSNALPTIMPMLTASIGISLGQAGLLNAFFGITNIIGQPIAGYFADRQRMPLLALAGVMLCTSGVCFLPLAPSLFIAAVLVIFLSAGTAMFHPQSFGICGRSGGTRNLAFFISMFAACGSLGAAFGPIYVVFVTSVLGRKGLPLMLIPIFLLCLFNWLRFVPDESAAVKGGTRSVSEFLSSVKSTLGRIKEIVAIASLRDAANQGLKLFLPMFIISRGGSIAQGGGYLFAVTLSATAAGVIGGKLADTIGYTKILIGALTLAPIFLLSGLRSGGVLSVVLLMCGFAFLQASTPVTTAMSQSRCPEVRSTASSLSMGISWGIANLATYPVGLLADRIGLEPTMYIVAFIPWIVSASFLAAVLRKGRGNS